MRSLGATPASSIPAASTTFMNARVSAEVAPRRRVRHGRGTNVTTPRLARASLSFCALALVAALGCRSSAKPAASAPADARAATPPQVSVDAPPLIDAAPVADVVDAAPIAVGPDAACPPQHPCAQACQRGHAHTTKLIDGCQVTVCCAPIDAP